MAISDWITDLVKITKDAVADIEKVDDIIDNYLDPVTDIVDTVGHIIAPIKALRSLYTAATRMRFKAFFRSYAKALSKGQIEAALNRMQTYSMKRKTRELIYQTIDDAIHSRSIYAGRVLGHVAGVALLSKEDPDMKTFIIINALRELNDLELECAVKIFELSNHAKSNDVRTTKGLIGAQNEYTVERFKRLLLLEPGKEKTYKDPGEWARFEFTEITEELIDYLKETGVYDELLSEN